MVTAILAALVPAPSLAAALAEAQLRQLPPPASERVQFGRDVRPILEAACIKCHGRGQAKGGFSLEDRNALLRGGDSGPAVVAGHSGGSYFIELVSGLNPDAVMPQKGSRLTAAQVSVLRAWIDQGLVWDEGVAYAKPPVRNLVPPRRSSLAGQGTGERAHAVDLVMAAYDAERGLARPEPVDDRLYARRVWMDVLGLLPSPEALEAFVRDPGMDKRARLVERLLADREQYATHWMTFWNDLLRNDYIGTGYIDGGRRQITGWLYTALRENLPFDQFVRELVTAAPGAEGFTKGIVWRGVVNASLTPEMQAAQNLSQVFMGVNLKCASCHDSFIDDWTLADAYGMAAVYAAEPLELVRCDKPTGQRASVRFLYPQVGALDGGAPREDRLRQLGALMTSEQNGRLSRTVVNRLWARLFGRGLVEPVDTMENPAWSPELLDWLAADLVEHGYDLQRCLKQILTSEAYQRPAVPVPAEPAASFVFRGPFVRRVSAEQFLDGLGAITGAWADLPAAEAEFEGVPYDLVGRDWRSAPRWIWVRPDAAARAAPGKVWFRRELSLHAVPAGAAMVVACDNRFTLYVNGGEAGSGSDHTRPRVLDLRPHLRSGLNVLAIEAANDPAKPDEPAAEQANPAGLILACAVWFEGEPGRPAERVVEVVSDSGWRGSGEARAGWLEPDAEVGGWPAAVKLGPMEMEPWKLGPRLGGALARLGFYGRTRAAWAVNDPLMTALGRPNREQVTTTRADLATTLQALELMNGATLNAWLRRGADRLLAGEPAEPEPLVSDVYRRALGRLPTPEERALAAGMVGAPPHSEGVQDLLWSVAMLPEFQLLH